MPKLLLGFILLLGPVPVARADDLLQLVLHPGGSDSKASQGAVERALAEAGKILQTLSQKEGSGYQPIAPGQDIPDGVRRGLRRHLNGPASVDHRDEEEEEEKNEDLKGIEEMTEETSVQMDHHHRKLIYCGYCGGCAGCTWCTRCGRRLQLVNKQRQIESELSQSLTTSYCNPSEAASAACSISAIILRINDDGTKVRAT
jgi:hypothetical protein